MRLDRLFIPFAGAGGSARFYIMVRRMIKDVMKWCSVFSVFLCAFTSAQYVLYRRQNAAIGLPYGSLHEECDTLDFEVGQSWWSSLRLMLDTVLTGDAYLQCFWQSSDWFGMVIMMAYVVFAIILMLNILIAMMARTFEEQTELVIESSALQYAKLVLETASLPVRTPPLNLLQIPVQVIHGVLRWLQAYYRGTARRRHQRASRASASDAGESAVAAKRIACLELVLTFLDPSREDYGPKRPFPGVKEYIPGDFYRVDRAPEADEGAVERADTLQKVAQFRSQLASAGAAGGQQSSADETTTTGTRHLECEYSFSAATENTLPSFQAAQGSRLGSPRDALGQRGGELYRYAPPADLIGRVSESDIRLADWRKRSATLDKDEMCRRREVLQEGRNPRAILEVALRLHVDDVPTGHQGVTINHLERKTSPDSAMGLAEGIGLMNRCRDRYFERVRDDFAKKAGSDEIDELAYDVSQIRDRMDEVLRVLGGIANYQTGGGGGGGGGADEGWRGAAEVARASPYHGKSLQPDCRETDAVKPAVAACAAAAFICRGREASAPTANAAAAPRAARPASAVGDDAATRGALGVAPPQKPSAAAASARVSMTDEQRRVGECPCHPPSQPSAHSPWGPIFALPALFPPHHLPFTSMPVAPRWAWPRNHRTKRKHVCAVRRAGELVAGLRTLDCENAVKGLAELCRADGPTRGQSARAFLRDAPASMAPHEAVRAAIVHEGGIEPLVDILAYEAAGATAAAVAQAMLVLCWVAMQAPLRHAVCEAGAVPLLVRTLQHGTDEEKELAAGTLANLATPHEGGDGVASALLESQAIPVLVSLAVGGTSGGTPKPIGHAAMGALNNLYGHPQLRTVVEAAASAALASKAKSGPSSDPPLHRQSSANL